MNPPLGASLVVNSEPHTGARPSVRVFVGLIKTLEKARVGEAASFWLSYQGGSSLDLKAGIDIGLRV
jgi:hypothetical protein